MDPVKASVIVCVYNRGREVQACLDSLLAMDERNFEIVLVDDASTDDTPEQLQAFRAEHADRRVVIVRNAKNLGVSGARNAGLSAANGEFVFFTDSDCVVDARWLTMLMRGFTKRAVAAVGGTVLTPNRANLAERAYAGQSRITRTRWQTRRVVGCNMGFRRDLACRYLFDEALSYYCDEEDITWRMEQSGFTAVFIPEAIVHHHHRLTLRGYLRMARRQGVGSARYWYKRGVYLGRDLWAGFAAVATLPLALWDARWLALPAGLALLQVGAIVFNEVVLKGKAGRETIPLIPIGILYQLNKAWGVATTWVRMLLGGEDAIRTSKMRWRAERRSTPIRVTEGGTSSQNVMNREDRHEQEGDRLDRQDDVDHG